MPQVGMLWEPQVILEKRDVPWSLNSTVIYTAKGSI